MTVTEPATAAPAPATSGGDERIGDRAVPWPVVLVVAATTSVLPLVVLLVVAGAPDGTEAWLAMAGPIAIGVAVTLSRNRVEAAVVTLGLAQAFLIAPGNAALDTADPWASAAGITLYLGVCWVTCTLGLRLPLAQSAAWMAGLALASLWGPGFDVPVVLGMGWWLVGRALRDRQQVTDRLQIRADELAAEQERLAAEAVRLERARIARELHDVIAHCMTVIVIQARAGQRQIDTDPSAVPETLDAILAAAAQAADDVESMVDVMDPASRPLTRQALADLVGRASAAGTAVRVQILGEPSGLDAAAGAVARRVVQEALTNVLRHAPGSEASVILGCRDGLLVTVENGRPAATEPMTVGTGRGLLGLRERVEQLGGTITWGPTRSGGWRLAIALP